MRAGMRLKRDHHRLSILRFCPPHDLVDHGAMSAVHAVEVPDTDQRRTEVAGNIVEFLKSQHSKSFYRRDAECAEKNKAKRSSSALSASRRFESSDT
jgi:hypothetical protein